MELGIKGHSTRSKEVIKLLEMLGGKNHCNLIGDDDRFFYYIYINDNYIYNSYIGPEELNGYEIFSLEEFLEKFPYKVGDKVNVWVNHEHFAGPRAELEEAEIRSMRWNCGRCEVAYRMKNQTGEFYIQDIKGKVDDGSNKQSECEQCGRVFGSVKCFDVDCPNNIPNYVAEFKDDKVNDDEQKADTSIDYAEINKQCFDEVHKRYSEITHVCLTGHGYTLPDGFHLVDENGNPIDASKIKLVKNVPYYPTSYNECLDVLSMEYATHYNLRYFTYERGYYEYATTDKLCSLQDKLNILGKLIICRNAYWKIAGDELGLDKPWEPDWDNLSTNHEFIIINKGCFTYSSRLLVFPTIEMRDAFYNNFKFLIGQCKELL